MITIENTCGKKHDVLYGTQVADGVATPTESKVGEIAITLATRRQHALESTAKTIFSYGSKERESNLHTEMSSDHSGMSALVSASSSDELGGTLVMQARLRV